MVARSIDGTKHSHDHLKTCQVKKEIKAIEFSLAKKAAGEKGKTVVGHFDPNVMKRKMACVIVMHEYPLSIVEHQGLMDVYVFSKSIVESSVSKYYQEGYFKHV